MKVYVVVYETFYMWGSTDIETFVFSNYENALKKFDEKMDQIDNYFSRFECEREDKENFYEVWEKGEYSLNHSSVRIFEEEVL